MAIFNSYVKLPEGTGHDDRIEGQQGQAYFQRKPYWKRFFVMVNLRSIAAEGLLVKLPQLGMLSDIFGV